MSDAAITTLEGLEAVIGKTPGPVNLKVIDHLDDHACRWIANSPLLFAGFDNGSGPRLTVAGGIAGFASGDRDRLVVPLSGLDDPELAEPGAVFGGLFLIPTIGETLRVNGRVAAIERDDAIVRVDECYGHCAKALIRSNFWSAARLEPFTVDLAACVAAARFVALATSDGKGHADISPKGDPAGAMAILEGDTLLFADRPGNRRTDSFRNIIDAPDVELALIMPGSLDVVNVRGRAALSTAPVLRDRFVVQDKIPALVTSVAISSAGVRSSRALAAAAIWPAREPATKIDPAQMFVDHVKSNRGRSIEARLVSAAVSIPGALRRGLEKDYKTNLY
ncbi:pyridoxamine 5-phosphate oxidase [Sphingomonas sp. CL5.1]|uniref:pyridoxamine 5'-phosphate oxidase family protein n=1 Tax=Sphingomonas sp. CL5.1 TaxID=2653203 RepID=UPI0015819985|nr:pyridoxamine 5'-phosphate oxidase family protein [Sphingomonas sp. CL5.1]QKS00488.1 pyridoxamine 5-phosphate oxidase [Sphingomonas sp. CL5.1]